MCSRVNEFIILVVRVVKKRPLPLQVRYCILTRGESIGMMRKPEGSRGESSLNDASIGAKMSSEQVAPTVLSSTPLYICKFSRVQYFFTEEHNDKTFEINYVRHGQFSWLRLSCSRVKLGVKNGTSSYLQQKQITMMHERVWIITGVS
jgi:hypothetical protein